MNTYKVALTAKRGKLSIIKIIRAITGWGLKETKAYVEQNFTFGSLDCDWAMFDVTVDALQMAELANYVAHRNTTYRDVKMTDSQRVEPRTVDPFDFTS